MVPLPTAMHRQGSVQGTADPGWQRLEAGGVAFVLAGFHLPAPGSTAIAGLKQVVGPLPDQLGAGLHADVLHHPQIEGTLIGQGPPLLQQGIVGVDQERVIELLRQLLLQRLETGKINDKATGIEVGSPEPDGETAAIAVHKAAMAGMAPLAMTAGVAAELFAAGVGGRHLDGRRSRQIASVR